MGSQRYLHSLRRPSFGRFCNTKRKRSYDCESKYGDAQCLQDIADIEAELAAWGIIPAICAVKHVRDDNHA